MDFVARTERRWGDAVCTPDGKLPLTPGFRSEKSVYSLERRAADGTRHVIVFNNSERETAFAHLAVPGEGDVALALPPLSWKYLELSADGRAERRRESDAAVAEEQKARQSHERLFEKRESNGMSTSSTPDVFTVKTPAQALNFNLQENGMAKWFVAGKVRGDMLGRDYFTTDGMFTEPCRQASLHCSA